MRGRGNSELSLHSPLSNPTVELALSLTVLDSSIASQPNQWVLVDFKITGQVASRSQLHCKGIGFFTMWSTLLSFTPKQQTHKVSSFQSPFHISPVRQALSWPSILDAPIGH